jgi:hypothetical protein
VLGERIRVSVRVSDSLDLTRTSQTLVQTARATDSQSLPQVVSPTTTYPNGLREPSDLDARPARMFSGENYKDPQTFVGAKRKRATSRPDDSRPTQTGLRQPGSREALRSQDRRPPEETAQDFRLRGLAYEGWPIGMEPAEEKLRGIEGVCLMEEENRCENCGYSDVQGETMYCRRYPPTRAVGSHTDEYEDITWEATTYFPQVQPGWWCGEWRP